MPENEISIPAAADDREKLLQALVRSMVASGSHDLPYILALAKQAGHPRWKGEPLMTGEGRLWRAGKGNV